MKEWLEKFACKISKPFFWQKRREQWTFIRDFEVFIEFIFFQHLILVFRFVAMAHQVILSSDISNQVQRLNYKILSILFFFLFLKKFFIITV